MSSSPGWARRVTGPTSWTPPSPSWEWPALPTATPPSAPRCSSDPDPRATSLPFPHPGSRGRVEAAPSARCRARHERRARSERGVGMVKNQQRRADGDPDATVPAVPDAAVPDAAAPPAPEPAAAPQGAPTAVYPAQPYAGAPGPDAQAPYARAPDAQAPDGAPAAQHAPAPYAAASAGIDPQHPFAGVTAGDYLRDVAAALLLLISLAIRWDFGNDATGRIDVVLITILSVFSLAVPYMARLGALGSGWTRPRIRLVPVSYTHLRAHETRHDLVCRLLLEKK